jgi:hypothetical protein
MDAKLGEWESCNQKILIKEEPHEYSCSTLVNYCELLILNMIDFIMWWEPALIWQRKFFKQIEPLNKEKSRLVPLAGIGTFIFGITIGPFFSFLSQISTDKGISISFIVSQFAFYSPFAIMFGIASAIREYLILQKEEGKKRINWK